MPCAAYTVKLKACLMLSKKLSALCAVCALVLSTPALAQDIWSNPDSWQGRLDVLTSGAAASVVLSHICIGGTASQDAARAASQRLSGIAQQMRTPDSPVEAIWDYTQDSFGMKVKAMWAANSEAPCSGLRRLQDLALGAGFSVPK